MIFASDLDQTLIYSTRSVGVELTSPLIMPAETVDGIVRSYMAVSAFEMLDDLSRIVDFVPVTTRTLKQYNRIEVFQERIQPKYAITSNGGNILISGVPDEEWNTKIHDNVRHESAPAADISTIFNRISNADWIYGENFCDDLFFSIVINREKMPVTEVQDVMQEIERLGWECSLQGRKLYFVPKSVSKSRALAQVQSILGSEIVIASGDSQLDRCMLDFSTHPIAPRHGELYREEQRNPMYSYTFTSTTGVMASTEILAYATKVIQTEMKVLNR